MKSIKQICAVLLILLLTALCTGCRAADTEPAVKSDLYDMASYENDEVFDIEPVTLSEELAEKCLTYRFTYLSDGYRIKGYLSIPAACAASGKPCKCVLYNRGGNRDLGMLDKNTTAHLCTVFDRIVIASQYRGGGGSEGADQFGGDDLHDVTRLIDLCQKHFAFADMDDFCAAGVSRGGMMTYMAARQDQRIRRIIAVSAVSDLFDAYESREDMRGVLLETIGCTPQENPDAYERRSAVYWADEIRIPVLMMHSTGDEQVAYRQAQALYEKLKDTIDCTLITYEDDTHGILHAGDADIIRDWLEQP